MNALSLVILSSSSFLKILFIFRERGMEGEKEGEKHQCVVASRMPPTGDLAHNPGMSPEWESNQLTFGSQASTQSTEPQQPGWFFSSCWPFLYLFISLSLNDGGPRDQHSASWTSFLLYPHSLSRPR